MTKTKTKYKTVTINRSRWAFGGKLFTSVIGITALYNAEKRTKCCLGFALQQVCGVSPKQMENHGLPSDVLKFDSLTGFPKGFDTFVETDFDIEYNDDSIFVTEAIDINDDNRLTLLEREKKLQALFKANGLRLLFKGKYSKRLLEIERLQLKRLPQGGFL